jgi:hypothetical protein
MALQGINMPLMPLGMEALQAATFAGLGLTAEQLQDFFPGPAFLAWGRMGNIQVRGSTAWAASSCTKQQNSLLAHHGCFKQPYPCCLPSVNCSLSSLQS